MLADSAARVLIAGADFSEIAAELIAERDGSAELIIVGARGAGRLRAVAVSTRRARPGAPWRRRRCRRPDVHIGDDGCSQGRPDNAPQPRRRRGDLATLGVRRRVGQPDAVADVPHRRHRVGVRRPVERRHHDPRAELRGRGGARHARAMSGDKRGVRADDAADARGRSGRGEARLLGAEVDRVRSFADHDDGLESGAADLPLLAVWDLWADRDDRRDHATRPGRPRP